jgi:asparagine synthase (glutamine-hydrolysing)
VFYCRNFIRKDRLSACKNCDMCGIVGIASIHPQFERDWLPKARDTLTHRGPDDAGEWWSEDGRVGLAHRRLSIMDVSTAGHQPMHFAERGLSIIFNGEIYNFRELRGELEHRHTFRSHSDTEVLLAAYDAWGTDCVSRFNGMFSFALYDAPRGKLFLARDRAGEKPLFYRLVDRTLYFASELKALMAHPKLPRVIDPAALDCYLAMGFIPGDMCMLKGFQKLSPAHAMQFDLREGTARKWRYWTLPELSADATQGNVNEAALLDELETLLEDAVGRQLVADVPVGVLLSGGVDSSLVTAMAARRSSNVKTFTILFPGHCEFDETEHARLIARHFNTEHVELEAKPTTSDLLPRLARQFDEPMVDSSMIPTFLVSQLVRQHCTVVLGGDGGDELFGGYAHYSRLLWMKNHLGLIPRPLRQSVSFAAEHLLPIGLKGRNWLQGLGVDLEKGVPLIASYFDAPTRRSLMGGHVGWSTPAEGIINGLVPQNPDLLQRATRMDFGNYLAQDILVKVDRASMLNSLEVRAPLLDYRLIEFAFGKVPSHLKTTTREKKILLKCLTSRMLPPEFDRQRKQGFSIPLADWLKTGIFREMFHEVLLDTQSVFDQQIVKGLFEGQDCGRNNGERLFALVLFELWRREYSVTF